MAAIPHILVLLLIWARQMDNRILFLGISGRETLPPLSIGQ